VPGPDIVERIETELDRLDPQTAPAAAPAQAVPAVPRRRPVPRRKGAIETATFRDLKTMPEALRTGAVAATALLLARELDTAGMTPRDTAGHARELRMHMTQLAELAPGERKGDVTDELRERRHQRLAAPG
jgi:hypothetical protein